MDIQRLRNLTTKKLHTKMSDVYEDIEIITGEKGIMTHQLANACIALESYLKEKAPNPRLWDDQYDPTHIGEIIIPVMTKEENEAFFVAYGKLPSIFEVAKNG